MPATLCVPLRRSRSCPPPTSSGSNAEPAAGHQHTDTLRATELVRRQRHQVDVRRDRAQVEPARRLNRVGVQHRVAARARDDRGDLGEVGDRADLVVDRHHADHRDGSSSSAVCERVEIDSTSGVDADDRPPSRLDGVQHGVVLDRRAQRHDRHDDRGCRRSPCCRPRCRRR